MPAHSHVLRGSDDGTIQMTTAWPPVGDCKLAFGVPGAPGMTFDAVVDVPKKCEGALVFQQHIDFCRQYREVGGKDMHRKSSGWALDTRDIYELMMVRSSGSIPFSTNDSPDNPVDGDEFSSASDRFRMYLLWFPKKISEPPMVPLGVAEWYWNAAATKGAATPSSGPTSAPASGTSGCTTGWTISTADANGYKGTATSTMPTMTKTAPDDFKDVPGAC